MAFLQATKLTLSFGERTILNNVELALSSDTKAALTGSNGSGKSTLLKIIAGVTPYDSGEIHKSANLKLGYLPQNAIIDKNLTLEAELEKAYADILNLIKQKEEIDHKISSFTSHTSESNSDELKALLSSSYELGEEIDRSDYYNRHREIELVLTGLGLDPSRLSECCANFSGGQQMRVALAKILLSKPHLLLLDEPTNYLDIEAREWLANFLSNYQGGYLLVSHDRYFLEQTTKETIEIFNGNLKRYKGNYSQYESIRKVELETLVKAYQKQQEEIEKNQIFIRRFKATASKASLVQSRIKALEKIQLIEIPDALKKIHFTFPEPPHCGEIVYTATDLEKSYQENLIFKGLNFTIKKGEKIAISGVNGAGKTTLLKILAAKDSNFLGSIKLGTGVKLGYFAQDSSDFLNPTSTVVEEIEGCCPTNLFGKIRSLLGAFLFSDDDIYKSISVLSGGEKNRLSLLKLLLQPYNLLILDEPTNHLDIHSKDVLLDALLNFSGTVLFVSHDRYFTKSLATRVFHLEDKKLSDYLGDYQYFCWKKENSLQPQNRPTVKKESNSSGESIQKGSPDFEKQKEYRNRLNSLKKSEEQLLLQIATLEEKEKALRGQLNLESVYSDHKKSAAINNELEEINLQLRELTQKWEKLATDIENILKE